MKNERKNLSCFGLVFTACSVFGRFKPNLNSEKWGITDLSIFTNRQCGGNSPFCFCLFFQSAELCHQKRRTVSIISTYKLCCEESERQRQRQTESETERQRDRQKRRGCVFGRNEQMHKYGMHCFHIHKLRWESDFFFPYVCRDSFCA